MGPRLDPETQSLRREVTHYHRNPRRVVLLTYQIPSFFVVTTEGYPFYFGGEGVGGGGVLVVGVAVNRLIVFLIGLRRSGESEDLSERWCKDG